MKRIIYILSISALALMAMDAGNAAYVSHEMKTDAGGGCNGLTATKQVVLSTGSRILLYIYQEKLILVQ